MPSIFRAVRPHEKQPQSVVRHFIVETSGDDGFRRARPLCIGAEEAAKHLWQLDMGDCDCDACHRRLAELKGSGSNL